MILAFVMVFQNLAVYTHMTVLENMAFGLGIRKILKMKKDVIIFDECDKSFAYSNY